MRAHLNEKILAGLGKAVLTPSVGQPDDIADVVVFLASDESRYITGQMLASTGAWAPTSASATAERRFGGGSVYEEGPSTYSPVLAWWYQPLPAWVPPSTWMVWPVM